MNAQSSVARASHAELRDYRSEVLETLRGDFAAVALAKVYGTVAATDWDWPIKNRAAHNAMFDAAMIVREPLEDLIETHCQLHGLDRKDMGELGEVVSSLLGEEG